MSKDKEIKEVNNVEDVENSTDTKEEVKRKSFNLSRRYSYDTNEQNENTDMHGISETEWKETIETTINNNVNDDEVGVDLLAYIFHDKDGQSEHEKEQGKSSLHVHILVRFEKSKTNEEVRVLFGVNDREENCQAIDTMTGSSRYLTHRTGKAMDEGKYQYEMNEVVCFNVDYKDMISQDFWGTPKNEMKFVSAKEAKSIVNKLAYKIYTGELRKVDALDELEDEAGYYYRRIYRKSFDADQEEFIEKKVEDLVANGRDNQTIYITGSGGIGKTVLATKLSNKVSNGGGVHPSSPLGVQKTPDALNHYKDQAVALFNELSPIAWSIDEFNACFDPHSYSPFPARNENKHFIGHTSIFTNSITPIRFAKDLVVYSKGGSVYQDPANKREIDTENADALDKYWQVRRRIKSIIVLLRDDEDDDYVQAHVFNLRGGLYDENGKFDKEDGTHVKVGKVVFKAVLNTKPQITDENIDDILKFFDIDVDEKHDEYSETIESFLEKHGLIESVSNDVISSFVEDVVSNVRWDLLPTTFLYDLYKSYRNKYYSTEDLLTIKEFTLAFEIHADDWVRKNYAVRVGDKMDADEPLISEYNLESWMNKSYKGSHLGKLRNFERKQRYRGFVRK